MGPILRIARRPVWAPHNAAMTASVDPTALCDAATLGSGTRVGPFVRISSDVTTGSACTVQAHAVLDGVIELADDVVIQTGARLLGDVRVERGVIVGPGAVVGEQSSGSEADRHGIVIHTLAMIGANATIRPGIVVGRKAAVQSGSVVTASVPAHAIVSGNPASITGYVDSAQTRGADATVAPPSRTDQFTSTVRGVSFATLTFASDLRGSLTATEFSTLPFVPQRLFSVFGVPSESVRGAHAHRTCSQLLICSVGKVTCLVDDGAVREEIELARPDLGLHIPPMVWGTQWRYSRDAVLLVLASHPYDSADYIRDYEEFLNELRP